MEDTCVLEKRQSIVTSEDRECGPPGANRKGSGLLPGSKAHTLTASDAPLSHPFPAPLHPERERERKKKRTRERERAKESYQMITNDVFLSSAGQQFMQTFRELHCPQVDIEYQSFFNSQHPMNSQIPPEQEQQYSNSSTYTSNLSYPIFFL